ncbi:DUF4179 domain-containing protein [Neobacillus sp. SCS-31]|uniref:DUF4179 domain-containing protein n=1 Tax=Neobacillus oceani TaxID=3115292 RepID=UPI003905DCB7
MKIDETIKKEINEVMDSIKAPSSLYEFVKNIKEESEIRSDLEKLKARKNSWRKNQFAATVVDAVKKRNLRKRSTISIIIAAILLISFATSIRVSPVIAKTVASIPGMERIVALIQDDRGLIAAVENDFYQPINQSQTINGVTVTLDGLIADKKGMVIFYSISSDRFSENIGWKHIHLREGFKKIGSEYKSFTQPFPIKFNQENVFSSSMDIEYLRGETPDSFVVALQIGDKVEHFKIPFTYEKKNVDSKIVEVNKVVTIEGQRITVKDIVIDPIRTIVRLEADPNNTKKFLLNSFDELKIVDDQGEVWEAENGISLQYSSEGKFELTLKDSLYFYEPKELTLSFGKIAAIDKDEAYILIDTEAKKFIKEPSNSIFSNLKAENGKVSFSINVNENYDTVAFNQFIDVNGKEFSIKYFKTQLMGKSNFVNGSITKLSDDEVKFEFELPWQSYGNPIRFEIDAYPSWIEEDVEIKIK